MITINTRDDYYKFVRDNEGRICVLYGAGNITRNNYRQLGRVDYICDVNAENIHQVDDIEVILPDKLKEFKCGIILLICIQKRSALAQVCSKLEELHIPDMEVFYLFDNPAFQWFVPQETTEALSPNKNLRIRLIYENDGWIFGKFADKLYEELTALGHDVSIDTIPDPEADVNHYIFYGYLTKYLQRCRGITTTMITHVDTAIKMELIKYQTHMNTVGICMSKDTMEKLTSWGIERNKICYVNPAQDGLIKPRKTVLGITNRCYGKTDFRKNDELVYEICKRIDPAFFEWKIMGEGWNSIVEKITRLGFKVAYYDCFDRRIYNELMPSLDYWLYYGFDEGAMGYLDAMAAGVNTIVTPQGYHLDTTPMPTYLCKTIDDFANTLLSIQNEKVKIVASVKDWTWENYAKKHLEIWRYLTRTASLNEIYKNQGGYEDGVFSLLLENNLVK